MSLQNYYFFFNYTIKNTISSIQPQKSGKVAKGAKVVFPLWRAIDPRPTRDKDSDGEKCMDKKKSR